MPLSRSRVVARSGAGTAGVRRLSLKQKLRNPNFALSDIGAIQDAGQSEALASVGRFKPFPRRHMKA